MAGMDEAAVPYTYRQAAEVLGIEAEAVRARLRRGALRRGPRTNDGRPTVLLSPADIETLRAGIRTAREESGAEAGRTAEADSGRTEQSRTIRALEGEAAALRDALDRERERADKAEAEAAGLRAEVAAERERVGEARERAARLEGELQGVKLALEAATRPWWRRWIGA